jgi:flagella basal body P-ring formation protein FlgA
MNQMLAFAFTMLFAAGGGDQDKLQPPFELVLKSSVMVRSADVRIADLCEVNPAGEEAFRIGQVVFGKAPAAGYTRSVNRSEILQALAAAGHPAARFQLKGTSEVVVQCTFTEVPAQELTEAANTVLTAVLAAENATDVDSELLTRVRHVQAPPGRQSLEVKARVRDGQTGQCSALVDVEILVDGERFKVLPVQYRLTRYQKVLKTTGAIRQGTPLGPENLVFSREKVAETQGLYLKDLDAVQGRIARRNLQGNQLLTMGDVSEPALIHRGELVTVVITRGRVKVTAKAVANHDAARGELVTLTNAQTRTQLTGVAEAAGTVVVGGN